MRRSDYQREENYNEYLRLLQNSDYLEVTFDEKSGGVSAVHRLHKFDKQQGVQDMRRSDYERFVLEVLRKRGHRVVLAEETNTPGVKSYDGYMDDTPMEIKSIEGSGVWSICTKLLIADKQRARCVILFFPDESLFSEGRIIDGIGKYLANPNAGKHLTINRLISVSRDNVLLVWDKKTTPIEGWSIEEGFRR